MRLPVSINCVHLRLLPSAHGDSHLRSVGYCVMMFFHPVWLLGFRVLHRGRNGCHERVPEDGNKEHNV